MRAVVIVAFLLLLPAGRAAAFGDCLRTAGYLDRFREGLVAQECQLIHTATIRAPGGASTLRLIRLGSTAHGDDSGWIGHVDRLAESVGRALTAMGSPRLPREISVLLTDEAEMARVAGRLAPIHAEITTLAGGECTLAFYKLGSGVAVEEFVFTLAHEIFHCVQYETWQDAAEPEDAEWWMEGSAEYFANLAMPGSSSSDGWISAFDGGSLEKSPLEMAYENVVLFLWLDTRGGPGAVADFLSRMRAADQMTTLRAVLPAADWTQFVENWLDGTIARPGGGAIRPAPQFSGAGTFDGPVELPMQVEPYVIARWDMTFVAEKLFDIAYQVTGGTMEAGMREAGAGGGWAAPPEQINTCEGEKSYILYFTATDGPASGNFGIDTDADRTGGACCLIGAWSPTQEALDGFAAFGMQVGAAPIAAAGGSLSCAYSAGGWVLSFGDDGAGALEFESNTTTCISTMRGAAMRFDETRSGAIGFDWEIVADGAGMAHYGDHSLAWTIVMTLGPMRQTQAGPDAGPRFRSHGFAFTCEGDDLTVQGIYGLSHTETPHVRFAE